jgi:drug/metabolite transporter (DMT)-like permease
MMPIVIDAFLVLLNHFLSAMMFVITKFAVLTAPSFFLVTWRMLASGIVTFGMYGLWKGWKLKLSQFDWFLIAALGLTNMVLKSALNFWAITYVSAPKAAFINSLNPFASAIFSYIFFKELFTDQKVFGLCIGLFGFLYYLIADGGFENGYAVWFSWPVLALLAAVLCNSLSFILIRYLKKYRNIDALLFNSLSMLVGSVMCVPILYTFDNQAHLYQSRFDAFPKISEYTDPFIFFFILLMIDFVITLQLKAHNLYKFRVTFMTFTASFVMPMMTAVLSYFIFEKPITKEFLIAYSIVFFGLYIFYREELKQGYIL